MKMRLLVVGALAALVAPHALSAQALGVAVRGGTMGFGAEGAVGFGQSVVVRAGLGLLPIEPNVAGFLDLGDDVKAKLELPGSWYNLGVDLYLGGSFRIGGGMLRKPDDPTLTITASSNDQVDIGDETYSGEDVSEIRGTLSAKNSAPYLIVGFGKHTSTGVGLFLDMGVAFLGDPQVTLEATEGNQTVIDSAAFQTQLAQEEQKVNDDLPVWAKRYWPILSVGLRIGLG